MQARNCLSANACNINCSTGMSCMLRRDVLDRAGGLAEFGQYLAEDHFIAEAIRQQWVLWSGFLLECVLMYDFCTVIYNYFTYNCAASFTNRGIVIMQTYS